MKSIHASHLSKKGFTIVELVIVIVVIAIVAAIAVLGYGAWRESVATKAVKSDLQGVQSSMSDSQNFGDDGFEQAVPDSFTAGDNVEVTYINGSSTEYCIEAQSTLVESVLWHIEGKVGSAKILKGPCPIINNWKELAASNDFTCAITTANAIWCWGSGSLIPTQLGLGDIPTNATLSTIAAGSGHFCVIANAWPYCWGANNNGRLGDNTTTTRTAPVKVADGMMGGKQILDVSAGGNHTCALTTDGLVYCWGYGANGALGYGGTTTSYTAIPTSALPGGITAKALSAGGSNTCVIGSNNWVYCWGAGSNGEIGNGGTSQVNSPTAVSTSGALASGSTVSKLTVGGSHICVIANTSSAYCWGAGFSGRLGNGAIASSSTPVSVTQSGVQYSNLWAGVGTTCAITAAGAGYCWGVNGDGQLGSGVVSSYIYFPVVVVDGEKPSGVAFNEIKPGDAHTCAIAADKKIYCWGDGALGKLGNNSTTSSGTPVTVTEVLNP